MEAKFQADNPKENNYLRAHILTYAGIIGGAFTILGNIQELVRITYFARVVVTEWNYWTNYFWNSLFSFIKFPIYSDVFGTLTIASMLLCASIGGQLIWRKENKIKSKWFSSRYIKGWHIPLGILILFIALLLLVIFLPKLVSYIESKDTLTENPVYILFIIVPITWLYTIPAILAIGHRWPFKERLEGMFYTQTLITLMDIGDVYTLSNADEENNTPFRDLIELSLYTVTAYIIMATVEPKAFNKRMRSIFLFFIILVALNFLQQPFKILVTYLFGD